jgi:hypothetical protein
MVNRPFDVDVFFVVEGLEENTQYSMLNFQVRADSLATHLKIEH